MSDMWLGVGEALRVGPRTVAPLGGFTPWGARPLTPESFVAQARAEEPDEEGDTPEPTPVIDPEAIALDGFARGYEEGRRALERELAAEGESVRRLAAGLESLRPEPPAALAMLIGETVGFLVRQIVGEAEIDEALLRRRAAAAAALVAEDARPARMRLHPDDAARLADAALGVELIADGDLLPGTVIVECRDGWIEDGPEVALDRLRAQLALLAVPR